MPKEYFKLACIILLVFLCSINGYCAGEIVEDIPNIVLGMIVGFFLFVAIIIILVTLVPLPLYIAAKLSGVRIGLVNIIAMRFRRIPPKEIIKPMIQATKGGLRLSISDLEGHYLSGGNVSRVVSALIAADKAALNLNFKEAAGIDLAGRDVLTAVQTSIQPKVFKTDLVAAMAKDGIQVSARAYVTVKANIKKLIGGAGHGTILARVGEGIVSAIGSSTSHKDVLENPDLISKRIMEKGLDAETAFQLLSVDIADVDVGRNIGAHLAADQAEADKQVAQAKAEERKAMAVARIHEMKALQEEKKARLVEAQIEVPKAMAEALRKGKWKITDYYKLKNLIADTSMREAIAQMR